jgi:uncharacterized membrane protein YkoI
MKLRLPIVVLTALLLALPGAAVAAKNKEQAAREAARQHDAKVLSVKEQKQGNSSVYVVKVLTKDGVVKTVRVPKDK